MRRVPHSPVISVSSSILASPLAQPICRSIDDEVKAKTSKLKAHNLWDEIKHTVWIAEPKDNKNLEEGQLMKERVQNTTVHAKKPSVRQEHRPLVVYRGEITPSPICLCCTCVGWQSRRTQLTGDANALCEFGHLKETCDGQLCYRYRQTPPLKNGPRFGN